MTSQDFGRMLVEIEGEGFPVVMIHGLGGTSNSFQPVLDAFRNHRTLRPDLPGAGRSPMSGVAPTIDRLAAAVVGGLRDHGVTRAHFVGHSMGTLICQRIAVDEPGLVASLMLLGALFEPSDVARARLVDRAKAARAEGMAAIAAQTASGTVDPAYPVATAFVRESLMRQPAEGFALHCEALAKAVAVDHAGIRAPTLLITGDRDGVAPPSVARQLGDRIAGAEVVILERCGHWPMLEKPLETSEKLRWFIGRVP